ncbi:MAG: hypothetical protein ACW98D_07460 [Promethearchaeota archaeon]|jgi:hypothetical protein
MNKKYSLIGFFLLATLLITSVDLVAAESDDDGDGIDDDFEEENKRDIGVELGINEIKIESHLRNGNIVDEIELKVEYDTDLSIEVSYESEFESELGNSTSENESEIEFEVEFKKLIEFVDLNDNGMYENSTDQFVQEVELNSFQNITYTSSIISADTTLHYLIVNTTDGVFTAHIFFVEEFAYVNDSFVTPTQAKIDIEITNFNYIELDSQIALYVKLKSEASYGEEEITDDEEDGYATDEEGVYTQFGVFSGIFTWKENATVDGLVMDVLASSVEEAYDNETEQQMILNYPRGSHIYHDPKIGINVGQVEQSILPMIITITVVSLVGVAVVVVAVVVIRKRRVA